VQLRLCGVLCARLRTGMSSKLDTSNVIICNGPSNHVVWCVICLCRLTCHIWQFPLENSEHVLRQIAELAQKISVTKLLHVELGCMPMISFTWVKMVAFGIC
jgi:hypothetical protein